MHLRVFFQGAESLMTFSDNKLVFQNTNPVATDARIGLGVLVPDTLCFRGRYGFADFQNVSTCLPAAYWDIKFFENRGIPRRVFKGTYGDNIILKEIYGQGAILRAYDEQGNICLYECEFARSDFGKFSNVYYNRLNEAVKDWENITDKVHGTVLSKLDGLTGDLDSDTVIARAGLTVDSFDRLDSGVLILHGAYEDLLVWGTTQEPHFVWCGTRVPLPVSK